MKRLLYIGLVMVGTVAGWLLLSRPVGAGAGDRGLSALPPEVVGLDAAALWQHPRLPSVLNGLVPSESERFFRRGREQGDREVQRLLQPQQDEEPILTVSPAVPMLPDDRLDGDRPAPTAP